MNRNLCIGILGGGQLAKMSALQAYKMGYRIAIYEKELNSPTGELTKNDFSGSIDDNLKLSNFAQASDLITLENEFIDHSRLRYLESLGKKVIPTSETIALIQDKLIQKQTLLKKGIPVPGFIQVEKQSYSELSETLGKKFVLKSRTMGYDGYGNALVKSELEMSNSHTRLSKRNSPLYAEEFIPFEMELAVMVARNSKQIKVYPVTETVQKNHICHMVIAPCSARMMKMFNNKKIKSIIKDVQEIAVETVKAVNGIGIFGVELFLNKDSGVLVNEMAPRPHNSGHYSIEGCVTSQFENHIRSVLNLPLGSTDMVSKFAVMINLLGKKEGYGFPDNYSRILKRDNVHLHIYGKEFSRPGRKMGHITVTGNNFEDTYKTAKRAASAASI